MVPEVQRAGRLRWDDIAKDVITRDLVIVSSWFHRQQNELWKRVKKYSGLITAINSRLTIIVVRVLVNAQNFKMEKPLGRGVCDVADAKSTGKARKQEVFQR
jgi:hypothetical protein